MRMKGKAAIVTGAGKGIGQAIAHRYVQEGARVMLTDIEATPVSEVAESLDMPYYVGDVSLKPEVDRMVAQTVKEFGRLDVMVANAGAYSKLVQFIDVEEKDFDDVIRTNLKSQFLCGQAAARQMILQDDGGAICFPERRCDARENPKRSPVSQSSWQLMTVHISRARRFILMAVEWA